MNKKTLLTTLIVSFGLAVTSHATVTLQFSTASAKLGNIQNAAGDAAGGLRWGIVVDTTGNGFDGSGLNYDGFTFPAANSGTFLANGSTAIATDDFFYWAGGLTLASAGGTDAATNAISSIAGVPLTGGVDAGDTFALIWFDTTSANDGDRYGFLTDPSFILPGDTSTTSYSTAFLGVDPVRLAANTFGATGVPEPSRSVLAILGLGLVFLRRRRA